MNDAEKKALRNAAASSAMEGLPLNEKDLEIVQSIIDGKTTLKDFFETVRADQNKSHGETNY